MTKLIIEIHDDEVTVLDAIVVAELKRAMYAAYDGGPDGDGEAHHRLMRGFVVVLEHYGVTLERRILPIRGVK